MLEKIMAKFVRHIFEKEVQKPATKDIAGLYDIAYCEDKNVYHTFDVYYPKHGETPFPLIIYVHGGAWVACDKNSNRSYAEYLASFGYCVLNMSYRLLPKTDLQGQLQDVWTAIQYFYQHTNVPQADKNNVIFMGDSAGAHLVSTLYCLMQQKEGQKNFYSSMEALPVKALVLQNMVSDLSDFTNSDKWYLKQMSKLMFKKHYKTAPFSKQASFLQLVNEDTKKLPIILIGSEHDALFFQSQKMEQYLQAHDWTYATIFWHKEDREELGHVFQVLHPEWEESKQTHECLFQMLKEVWDNGNQVIFTTSLERK